MRVQPGFTIPNTHKPRWGATARVKTLDSQGLSPFSGHNLTARQTFHRYLPLQPVVLNDESYDLQMARADLAVIASQGMAAETPEDIQSVTASRKQFLADLPDSLRQQFERETQAEAAAMAYATKVDTTRRKLEQILTENSIRRYHSLQKRIRKLPENITLRFVVDGQHVWFNHLLIPKPTGQHLNRTYDPMFSEDQQPLQKTAWQSLKESGTQFLRSAIALCLPLPTPTDYYEVPIYAEIQQPGKTLTPNDTAYLTRHLPGMPSSLNRFRPELPIDFVERVVTYAELNAVK